jgi:predicted nucleic acid-binding protein
VTVGEIGLEPVVDTMIAGALFSRPSQLLETRYRAHLLGRPLVLSFATVAELRFGAYKAHWGQSRIDALEKRLKEATVVMPDSDLVESCARLRAACRELGHPLHEKVHDADRWIAATAIRFGLALVSDDRIYVGAPGLTLRQE